MESNVIMIFCVYGSQFFVVKEMELIFSSNVSDTFNMPFSRIMSEAFRLAETGKTLNLRGRTWCSQITRLSRRRLPSEGKQSHQSKNEIVQSEKSREKDKKNFFFEATRFTNGTDFFYVFTCRNKFIQIGYPSHRLGMFRSDKIR